MGSNSFIPSSKNYWNTHLRKKLNGFCTDPGQHNRHQHHGASTSSSSASAKGQWERNLQTDIHMAKQALSDALSFDSKFISSWQQPPYTSLIAPIHHQPELLPPPPGNFSTNTYALSAENIERLLPNWLKISPKSSQKSSESISTFNQQFQSPSTNEGLKNYSNSEVSETTSLFLDEIKPVMEAQMLSLSFLETCLFDDAVAQGHEGLMNISLEDSDDLF